MLCAIRITKQWLWRMNFWGPLSIRCIEFSLYLTFDVLYDLHRFHILSPPLPQAHTDTALATVYGFTGNLIIRLDVRRKNVNNWKVRGMLCDIKCVIVGFWLYSTCLIYNHSWWPLTLFVNVSSSLLCEHIGDWNEPLDSSAVIYEYYVSFWSGL